jgi:hypothetical protein
MFVLRFSVEQSFAVLIILVVLTYFKTARLSRALWLNVMVKYEGKK